MARYLEHDTALIEKLADVRVLYTDLDGTLLGGGGRLLVDEDNQPSTLVAEAIVGLNQIPLTVVPVSGRSRLQLTEIVRLCGWQDYIAEAGCVRTYWNGTTREIVYDLPGWDPATINDDRTPLELIHQSGALQRLQEHFPGAIEHHAPWHLNRDSTDVLRGYIDYAKGQELLADLELPVDLIENGAINPKEHTLTLGDEQIHAYHLAPKGCSKSRAIALDLEHRGLTADQAIMIGDSASDLECAESVGLLVLVENALKSPSVVARVDQVPNAVLVQGKRGTGWAQLAKLLIQAQS